MITFINKFLLALSDEELEYLKSAVYTEQEKRMADKRAKFGPGHPPLNEEEKATAERGLKIQAIQMYRARTGTYLKEAKDMVEYHLRSIGK